MLNLVIYREFAKDQNAKQWQCNDDLQICEIDIS
jgi:hypothetical protein